MEDGNSSTFLFEWEYMCMKYLHGLGWHNHNGCFGTRKNYGVKVQLRITTALLDEVNEEAEEEYQALLQHNSGNNLMFLHLGYNSLWQSVQTVCGKVMRFLAVMKEDNSSRVLRSQDAKGSKYSR